VIVEASAEGDGVAIGFADGSLFVFSFAELAAMTRPTNARRTGSPWIEGRGVRSFDAKAFWGDPLARRRALAAVAREGACLLTGAGTHEDALGASVSAFGFVRETNYGRFFDVRVEENAGNLAFTDLGLAPHTDNPYRDPAPTLQLLHCIRAAGAGGETILVDGFVAAERLRATDADAFVLLATTPVRFAWRDCATMLETRACVIEQDSLGEVIGVRVNDRALAPLDISMHRRNAWREAYAKFVALIGEPVQQQRFSLASGDVLIFDNRRILHGRTAYADGGRWLRGCYSDRDGLLSTLAILEHAEAMARVREAMAPLAGARGEETYGEGLSLRAHSLQAAALASAEGRSNAFVAAALLHDLGWTVSAADHEQVGADLALRWFGESVARPIRLHVAAKRYLVSVEPAYLAGVSAASKATLATQGGPMTRAEARAFEDEPGFADGIALRRIDEAAKDPHAQTLRLEDYCDLLADLARDQIRAEDTRYDV